MCIQIDYTMFYLIVYWIWLWQTRVVHALWGGWHWNAFPSKRWYCCLVECISWWERGLEIGFLAGRWHNVARLCNHLPWSMAYLLSEWGCHFVRPIWFAWLCSIYGGPCISCKQCLPKDTQYCDECTQANNGSQASPSTCQTFGQRERKVWQRHTNQQDKAAYQREGKGHYQASSKEGRTLGHDIRWC